MKLENFGLNGRYCLIMFSLTKIKNTNLKMASVSVEEFEISVKIVAWYFKKVDKSLCRCRILTTYMSKQQHIF